ncbi:ParB N-terminal domain-containing protein [uncultured Methanobrevibacter sp.]|uniref:ParB N-terminal domain-containing protein n=1 Tax=uncultured Methanobrevibacter sp. TaxID=253161 RepID=UPI0025ED4CB1|nr:ParB N-terminal domain-containing protein [uncultured Methanobrevibacter sp.]
MKIEKIKITDLVPAEYNPRKITPEEKQKLKNSIDNFGIVEPILIALSDNEIIGGHQRFDVLFDQYLLDNNIFKELNLLRLNESFGWVFPDNDKSLESEDMKKALNLVLNRVSGEWDENKLQAIFTELKDSGFNNMGLTGFNNDEITGFTGLKELNEDATIVEEDIQLDTSMIIPEDEPEYDESIADNIETITCPRCGYELPKEEYSQ